MSMLLLAITLLTMIFIVGNLSNRTQSKAFNKDQKNKIKNCRNKVIFIGFIGFILSLINVYLNSIRLSQYVNDELYAISFFLIFGSFFSVVFMLVQLIFAPTESSVKTEQKLIKANLELKSFLSNYHIDKTFLISPVDQTTVAICQKDRYLLIYNLLNLHAALPFSKIVNCEILEDNVTIMEGGLGRAIVGAFVAGGTGAIVGATTRSSTNKINSLYIRIITSDILNPYYLIELINFPIERSSKEYKEKFRIAQELYATIIAIIHN